MTRPQRPTAYTAVTTLLSLTISLCFLITSSHTTSAASHNNKSLSIVLIGDSYTAGNGAGSLFTELISLCSLKAAVFFICFAGGHHFFG